jgi:hypothetical protein
MTQTFNKARTVVSMLVTFFLSQLYGDRVVTWRGVTEGAPVLAPSGYCICIPSHVPTHLSTFGSNSQDRAQGVNHLAGKVKVQMPDFRDACVQSAS